MWEHILYSPLDSSSSVTSTLIEELIPVLRGVASFFIEHMIITEVFDGVAQNVSLAQTGPSSSPENSFEIQFTREGRCSIALAHDLTCTSLAELQPPQQQAVLSHLAFSPSIDATVLRQVEGRGRYSSHAPCPVSQVHCRLLIVGGQLLVLVNRMGGRARRSYRFLYHLTAGLGQTIRQ